MSAQAAVKSFRERLKLYFSKSDAIEKNLAKYKDDEQINLCQELIHDNFTLLSNYLESRDDNELLQGSLLDIFQALRKFDFKPTYWNFTDFILAIRNYIGRDVLIYFSFKEGNGRIDLSWLFSKTVPEPALIADTSKHFSFLANLNSKIMVYKDIKFIPDKNIRPCR